MIDSNTGEQVLYLLMRHDDEGRNLAYLYERTARVIETVGEGKAGVDIVEIRVSQDGNVEYVARYQLGRLQSGMEHRSSETYYSIEGARAMAEKQSAAIKQMFYDREQRG